MKTQKLPVILCAAMAASFALGLTDAKAAEQDTTWNYTSEITETAGAFTYHAIASQDEKEAWIYEVTVDKSKEHAVVTIPETLQDKTVTCIGYAPEKDPDRDDSFNKNLFGSYAELNHNVDGGYNTTEGIKEIVMPSSLEKIMPTTFSGANDVKTITIPEKVTVIEEETFYSCNNLKTLNLPTGLKELDVTAFIECAKLNTINLSAENTVYEVKNNCVITKADKALVYALPVSGTYKIPNGITAIRSFAFCNCKSSKITIPASVTKLEDMAFQKTYNNLNKKIKNITVAKKNKVYAKDGQCIYNKKDKSLAIGIINKKGEIKISNKVKKLTNSYNLVGWDIENNRIKKVTFPKNLKSVESDGWEPIADAKKIYFTAKKVPKVTGIPDAYKNFPNLPIFTDVYVPKDSYKTYKKWYKKYKSYSSVKMHTY